MSDSDIWNTSVSDLIRIFRNSLLALIPYVEQAKIPWKQGEAYDEWDEITQVLYKNIVTKTIQWGCGYGSISEVAIPDYNMLYKNYSQFSLICVADSKPDDSSLVFHSFSSRHQSLDMIQYVSVPPNGVRIEDKLMSIPFEDSDFCFRERVKPGQFKVWRDLCIKAV
jgi:hypothetical protein